MSMRSAFEKAGYRNSREEWPSDELLQVAVRAMTRHADDTNATQHAIFRACYNDPALLRQLLLPWWRQATASIITEARRTIRQRESKGELETAIERRAAKVVRLEDERELAREAKEREEELARIAEHDRYNREELNKWLKTKASLFEINERPFWEVSTREAANWQRRQSRDAKFVELVLSGVPEDDRPISYYRRPEEINELWDMSRQAA